MNAKSNTPVEIQNGIISGAEAHQSFPIVGIGASAGGLESFIRFFEALPDDPGMAFVLIQHLDPNHDSMMSDLLSRHTALNVLQVRERTSVCKNTVYIIPPGKFLGLEAQDLVLSDPPANRGMRMTVDHFFKTLAETRREKAICIILSGTAADGTLGMKAIKANGGLALVQDPETAKYDGMPRSAISTGAVDRILAPEDMPEVLLEYELKVTRGELQATIEELETAKEELKASNEEAMSMNEELQSNEELETNKEELQSLNEELTTVNNELREKVRELEEANNDMANLLANTHVPAIFLYRDLRIKLFTPAASELMRLVESDIGRHFDHIARRFKDPELIDHIHTVLRDAITSEKEVQTDEQNTYIRRILPYRTQDDRIDGVVITFVDITQERKHLDEIEAWKDQLRQTNISLEKKIAARTRSLEEKSVQLQRLAAGQYEVQSTPGKGTAITLRVPETSTLSNAEDCPPQDKRQDGSHRPAAHADKQNAVHVLIVDDHQIFREGLRSLLETKDHITVVGEAANGQEAVKKAAELMPDVILMDVNMPHMNGIEATHVIAAKMPQIKIIGLSVNSEEDMTEAMLAAGADAYLTKGGPSRDLLAKIGTKGTKAEVS